MAKLCLDKKHICGDIMDAFNELDFVGRSAYPGYPQDGRFSGSTFARIFEFKNKMTGVVRLTINQGGLQSCNLSALDKKSFKKALLAIAGNEQTISNHFTGQLELEYAQGILQKASFIEKA